MCGHSGLFSYEVALAAILIMLVTLALGCPTSSQLVTLEIGYPTSSQLVTLEIGYPTFACGMHVH